MRENKLDEDSEDEVSFGSDISSLNLDESDDEDHVVKNA